MIDCITFAAGVWFGAFMWSALFVFEAKEPPKLNHIDEAKNGGEQ